MENCMHIKLEDIGVDGNMQKYFRNGKQIYESIKAKEMFS